MIEEIFTGGHFSSGTRLIQLLLKNTHKTYSRDETMDYECGFSGAEWGNSFSQQYLANKDPSWQEPSGRLERPFAIKNPSLMLAIPQIKKLFPDSKFILVVRNGLDQVLCDNRAMSWRYIEYYPYFKDIPEVTKLMSEEQFLQREMKFWNEAYKKAVADKPDLVIRLEDLVSDREETIKKITDLLGIPRLDGSFIKRPSSMGRYKNEWIVGDSHKLRTKFPQLKEIHYHPDMISKLLHEGGEMMNYFGYEI